jgi:hypothetical protein
MRDNQYAQFIIPPKRDNSTDKLQSQMPFRVRASLLKLGSH